MKSPQTPNPPALRLTDLAQSLPASVPFVGPEAAERRMGRPFLVRLGANEQRFGPSPMAVAAMAAAGVDAWMYGDPEAHDLRAALAAKHRCRPENIIIGEGVDGLLGLLVRLMIAPGDGAVTSLGGYATFGFHVAGFGGRLISVPYLGDTSDAIGLIAAAQVHRPKLVYIANPDNPMGGYHGKAVILDMLNALPQDSLLILDEAYADFAPKAAPEIAADDPRLIRFRSFSKSYGLAGLRLGYGIAAPQLVRAFDLVRNHFGVGRLVQAAGLAALRDDAHLAHVVAGSVAARARLAQIAADNGLRALPSASNFSCLDLGRDGAFASQVLGQMTQMGVFMRMPSVAPLNRCLRISHGTAADLDIVADALPRALHGASLGR